MKPREATSRQLLAIRGQAGLDPPERQRRPGRAPGWECATKVPWPARELPGSGSPRAFDLPRQKAPRRASVKDLVDAVLAALEDRHPPYPAWRFPSLSRALPSHATPSAQRCPDQQ
jgi:hypothetical protein